MLRPSGHQLCTTPLEAHLPQQPDALRPIAQRTGRLSLLHRDQEDFQEKVVPVEFAHHRGWFRVFCAFGLILPCWWNDETHVYEELTPKDEEGFRLQPLRPITTTIQQICGLDFFSTEIAMTPTEKFVVVDYVNEMCDMRLQSRHPDGVPDHVVLSIAEALVDFTLSQNNPVG